MHMVGEWCVVDTGLGFLRKGLGGKVRFAICFFLLLFFNS